MPGDPGALAFHAGLAPSANVVLYIEPNVTSRDVASMLLSRLGATDCEWLRRLFFALAEGGRARQILSKYHTILPWCNSVEAVSPARDLMWTVEGVVGTRPR